MLSLQSGENGQTEIEGHGTKYLTSYFILRTIKGIKGKERLRIKENMK